MLALTFTLPKVFEAVMVVCFGISWPFSIHKVRRTKRTEGKSPVFVSLILGGYCSGIVWKLLKASEEGTWPEAMTLLYAVNGLLVAVDLALYFKYRSRPGRPQPDAQA